MGQANVVGPTSIEGSFFSCRQLTLAGNRTLLYPNRAVLNLECRQTLVDQNNAHKTDVVAAAVAVVVVVVITDDNMYGSMSVCVVGRS